MEEIPSENVGALRVGSGNFVKWTGLADGEDVFDLSHPQLLARSNDEKVGGREAVVIDGSAEEIVFQRLHALAGNQCAEKGGSVSEGRLAERQSRRTGVFAGFSLVKVLDLRRHAHLRKGGEEIIRGIHSDGKRKSKGKRTGRENREEEKENGGRKKEREKGGNSEEETVKGGEKRKKKRKKEDEEEKREEVKREEEKKIGGKKDRRKKAWRKKPGEKKPGEKSQEKIARRKKPGEKSQERKGG